MKLLKRRQLVIYQVAITRTTIKQEMNKEKKRCGQTERESEDIFSRPKIVMGG